MSVSSSSEPDDPYYVWCEDRELHVGQDDWAGFEEEREDFMEDGGEVTTVDEDVIDEYWVVAFGEDVAECATVPVVSPSPSPTASSSSSSSHQSSNESKPRIPIGPAPQACNRLLGVDAQELCYPWYPYVMSWEDTTIFLGDYAVAQTCSYVCEYVLRTLAMCMTETGCGTLDANTCVLEGYALPFHAVAEARTRGYGDDVDLSTYDFCMEARDCIYFEAC